MCKNIKETTMTDNMQEELSEKPTKTELKKIKEALLLSALVCFYIDISKDNPLDKVPEGFLDKLDPFIDTLDENTLKSVLIDSLKKQITKVNKLL